MTKEHKISFYISISLLILAFSISYLFHNFKLGNYFESYVKGENKYYIFIVLAISIYFLSYFFISKYTKNIKELNEKLKSYNHNLAHEIQTPIAVIKSNLELLDMGYDRELIKSSIEETDLLKDIVNNLLFLSENNSNIKKDKISIFDILSNNFLDEEIILEKKQDFEIYANETLIKRLVSNIISNAKKYKTNNSKIKIIISKNSISFTNTISKKLDIKDSNVLFDAFYKAGNADKTSGYGLGLSIVKKIADLHNLNLKIFLRDNEFEINFEKK